MASPAGRTACFTGLPVEILLEVYQQLDLDSVFRLSTANQFFMGFFEQRRAAILLPALHRDFSPFEELLQVYTASENDIITQGGLYRPRMIIFKRFVGDSGRVLAHASQSRLALTEGLHDEFLPILKGRKPTLSTTNAPNAVFLTERDLDPLLSMCRLVRKWEELFPQMRWFHQPDMCRFLRPHEKLRFRRALYRWWLYGNYFHGEFPRPRMGHPEPLVADIRTSQMRFHCTGELLELMDLLEAVKDVILQYICPRLDQHQHQVSDIAAIFGDMLTVPRKTLTPPPLVEAVGRSQSLATSWNDQSVWGRIVKTYTKLGPQELLYYFDNICSYPRNRLINEIRLDHPSFSFDQESIQIAIRCALDERRWLDTAPSLAEDDGGGIVDFDDERDSERAGLGDDASPDGSLPPGLKFVQTLSRYSPRGDDGSHLESHQRLTGFESRLTASTAAV
ncbi:F-box domain protein [Ophiocordyceps sinensis CO18]|uniref:F-box domain protein n=1 Tax=Ophiocordyceps sinensis (strain Co18 / CGMCC 3.14243) TaxID=911162 RepID=T5ANZ6_OPHSC|nr:F-box domain protein [Ophiocordyceps sinensis CO18]